MNEAIKATTKDLGIFTQTLGHGSGELFCEIFAGNIEGPKYLAALNSMEKEIHGSMTLKNKGDKTPLIDAISNTAHGPAVKEVLCAVIGYAFGSKKSKNYLCQLACDELQGNEADPPCC